MSEASERAQGWGSYRCFLKASLRSFIGSGESTVTAAWVRIERPEEDDGVGLSQLLEELLVCHLP